MKTILTSFIILIASLMAQGQSLYTKTFGDSSAPSIIFLHGGPGYNCANFEVITAQRLADKGFFVVVYDRRGEGRSKAVEADYTFAESFDDLNAIYQSYGLTKATLIGHSFGGIVATLFATKFPDKVQSIVLVGAPVSLQKTFKHILAMSKSLYASKNDSENLKYIAMLEQMDTTSIAYSSYCFGHAMQNGFYTPKTPTAEAKSLYSLFRTDTLLTKYAAQMSYEAPQGFWQNEKYTTLDLTAHLQALQAIEIPIYGLYGKEDGLYAPEQVRDLQALLGANQVMYLNDCSHSVFIDQQSQFIEAVITWAK